MVVMVAVEILASVSISLLFGGIAVPVRAGSS
jgi:hypothetical protein